MWGLVWEIKLFEAFESVGSASWWHILITNEENLVIEEISSNNQQHAENTRAIPQIPKTVTKLTIPIDKVDKLQQNPISNKEAAPAATLTLIFALNPQNRHITNAIEYSYIQSYPEYKTMHKDKDKIKLSIFSIHIHISVKQQQIRY